LLEGPAERLKLGDGLAAATVSVIDAVALRPPDVPFTLNAVVPMAAVLSATRVRTLVVVVPGGLKEAFTPGGKPEADRTTLSAKPFCPSTVTVVVLLPP
jgi:hypothetical protein